MEHSDSDVMKFVANDFYVDDALTSLPTPAEAISLLKRTRNDLQRPYRYWPTEGSVTCAEKSRLKLDVLMTRSFSPFLQKESLLQGEACLSSTVSLTQLDFSHQSRSKGD